MHSILLKVFVALVFVSSICHGQKNPTFKCPEGWNRSLLGKCCLKPSPGATNATCAQEHPDAHATILPDSTTHSSSKFHNTLFVTPFLNALLSETETNFCEFCFEGIVDDDDDDE